MFLDAKQKVWITVYCGGVWMNLKAPTSTDMATESIVQSDSLPSSASSATWPGERRGVGRFGCRLLMAAVHTAKQKRNPGFLCVRWVILNPEVTAGGSSLKLQISVT